MVLSDENFFRGNDISEDIINDHQAHKMQLMSRKQEPLNISNAINFSKHMLCLKYTKKRVLVSTTKKIGGQSGSGRKKSDLAKYYRV